MEHSMDANITMCKYPECDTMSPPALFEKSLNYPNYQTVIEIRLYTIIK